MKIVFDNVLSAGEVSYSIQKSMERVGFLFEGKRYQVRRSDRPFITSILVRASAVVQAGSQEGDLRWHSESRDFAWISMDNTSVPMDAQTALRLATACLAVMDEAAVLARSLKDHSADGGEVRESEVQKSVAEMLEN